MNPTSEARYLSMENSLTDYDVIISSKIRLARNIADISFPGHIKDDEAKRLNAKLRGALEKLPEDSRFYHYTLDQIEPILLKFLQEKNYLEPDYYYKDKHPIHLNHNKSIMAEFCHGEHLRLFSIKPGRCLNGLYGELDKLDTQLEGLLDYTFSLEWGYHNSSLTTMGTGLKASLLLHLPALVITSMMEDVKTTLDRQEMLMQPLYIDDKSSFGSLFIISNHLSFGYCEQEIIDNLQGSINGILNLERKSRQELISSNRLELEDRIFRAYGTLKHARIISFQETIEHLSFLRMGICCGIIDNLILEDISSLFFLLQDEHIKKLINKFDSKEKDIKFINKMRAKIIRDLLEKDEDFGGKQCLKD